MPVRTLVSVDGDRVPENMAFGPDGALYFGITAGELRRVPAGQVGMSGMTIEDTEQVATLPDALGVEAAPDGTVYVAANSQDSVVRVTAEGETDVVADSEDELVSPSDVVFGTGEMADSLFICNFAPGSPEEGAIPGTTV